MPKLRILNNHRDILKAFKEDWEFCEDCTIGEWANNKVHVRGFYPAPVLFIGEAPGREENMTGYPFTGQAGDIFDALVEGLGVRWAVINTVACRPCDTPSGSNRQPSDFELGKCQSRIERLIRAIDPKMIIKLGKVAESCSYLSAWFLPVLNARHPAYILRLGGVSSHVFRQQRKLIHAFVTTENKTDKQSQGASFVGS